MWNSTNSSIKFLDLGDALFTKDLLFSSDFAASSAQIQGKGLSKLYDKFTMTFLDNEIGQYLATKVEQSVTRNYPFIAISFKELVSGFLKRSRTCSAECFLKPMEKAYVSIGDFKNTAIVAIFIAISWFVLEFTGMKTSFSIDYASKIGKMNWIMNLRDVQILMFKIFVDKLCHITSLVNRFINQYTHEAYLSPG